MTHVRKQIRDRVVADLTGLTTTGGRIFDSRLFNFENAELPALAVYCKNETSERDTMGSSSTQGLARTLIVQVEGYASAPSGSNLMENTLDTIAEEVETALANDWTLNSLAKDCFLSGTDIDFQGQDSDSMVGTMVMEWTVLYRTNTNAPGTAL